MSTHSLLSPSTAKRWMTCPGSVALCRDLPPEESEYAAEGTAAHAWAEALLSGRDDYDPWTLPYDTDDMRRYVQTYVDFVKSLGGFYVIERRVDLSQDLGEDAYGTADAVVWAGDDLYIIDLKYGMSYVDAYWNPQLALYAAGFLRVCAAIDTVKALHLCIVQPRLDNISQWDTTPDELAGFVDTIRKKAAIARIMAELPESDWLFVPDESACKYCRARGTCRALCRATQTEGEPARMTPEELAEAYARVGLVKLWADAAEKAVYSRLLNGVAVPGLKLVDGRKGARKWRSEQAAVAAVIDAGITADVYEHKLLSPAKMEKLLKDRTITRSQWDALALEITQENTKPVIADETDTRPEYRPEPLTYPNMENTDNG